MTSCLDTPAGPRCLPKSWHEVTDGLFLRHIVQGAVAQSCPSIAVDTAMTSAHGTELKTRFDFSETQRVILSGECTAGSFQINAGLSYLHACRVLLCLQALDEALVAPADRHHLTSRPYLVHQGLYVVLNSPHPLASPCAVFTLSSRRPMYIHAASSMGFMSHHWALCLQPLSSHNK